MATSTTSSIRYQAVIERTQPVVISLHAQIIVGLLLVLTLCGKVWLRIASTEAGYQIGKERQRIVELDMKKRELELERSLVLRPDALSRTAELRLGMKPLSSDQAWRVGE